MTIRGLFLGTAALAAFVTPALADEASIEKRLDAMQQMIDSQQKQIESQKSEIGQLRKALAKRGAKTVDEAAIPAAVATGETAAAPAAPSLEDRVAAQESKIEELSEQANQARLSKQEQPTVSLAGGRPTITSADGRFSAALRSTVQYDIGYFMQDARAAKLSAANGPDLSSGSNFRRAQLGLQGKLFGDWSYYFNYDFGSGVSSGNELQGRIQQAWVEYDGLAPVTVRIGAFPPSANLEDATSPADTLFFERNSPSDVARNIAGGDGRDAVAVTYAGERVFASIAYTGAKVAETTLAFDEQEALMGRVNGLVYATDDVHAIVGANATYVFRAPDSAPGPGSLRGLTLQDLPEMTVDAQSTRLVSTGSVNTEQALEWGAEGALQWLNVYGQAGYFGYEIDPRTPGASTLDFDGWYAQASYVLTGESRNYNSGTGSFTAPRPRIPFSFSSGGWGAWEIAARYSDLDVNDHAGVLGAPLPTGGIRGGEQRIFTAALNWYPNTVLKFALQFQDVQISRIGTFQGVANSNVGQNFDTLALRTQIAF